MKDTTYERMDGTYSRYGDYLYPELVLNETAQQSVGILGQRHLHYLKEHKKAMYVRLLFNGTLNSYLAEVDCRAEERFAQLVNQMAVCEGITEELKASDQMAWIAKMNNIRNQAMEIVNAEIIFA